MKDTSITAPDIRPGVWNWLLIVLLTLERLVAWWAFDLDDPWRRIAVWERPFLLLWGLGLLIIAVFPLIHRWRLGGWSALLSGLILAIRSCVPLLSERPAAGAVVALMVASATLTFGFLYEQSFWPMNDRSG